MGTGDGSICGDCKRSGEGGSHHVPGTESEFVDGRCQRCGGSGDAKDVPEEQLKVYLVATGELHGGEETYTRHEGAPPPLCEAECLYTRPQAKEAESEDDVLAALDLPVAAFRTEGGVINRAKLRAALLHPDEYLPAGHWLRAGRQDGEPDKRRCSDCGHEGDEGGSTTQSYCGACGETIPYPKEDLCSSCGASNCMLIACPQCGGKYEPVEADAEEATSEDVSGLRSAVKGMTQLLAGNEWAEHLSNDPDAQALESQITRVIGDLEALRQQMKQSGQAAGEVVSAEREQPRLTVRLTSFPESNGKRNWTALLVRADAWDGLVGNCGGVSLARGEMWNQVAYYAECARLLIGERVTEPHILDYGDDIETPEGWAGEVHGGRQVRTGPGKALRSGR